MDGIDVERFWERANKKPSNWVTLVHNGIRSDLFPSLYKLIGMMEEVGQDTSELKAAMENYDHLLDRDAEDEKRQDLKGR